MKQILLLLLAACASTSILSAQAVNATLLGTVTDTTGAAVPNAKVTATETATGVPRIAQTNESGNYSFPNLPPGVYSVTVEQTGFKKASRANIDVVVDTTARVDLRLEPGNISETIEVTATTPELQTDRADTGSKIETAQAASMPLGTNRNFQTLLNLAPGTTQATFDHSQFFNASSSLQTQVNGQLREGNAYLIEGTYDNERTGLLQIVIPPIEAIQTVDISTSNYDASMGNAVGAVTNVILKSGTNGFHGAGYEFLQNSDLDARSFFNPSVGHLAYNYFGGNIGGPIKKNKIFFFGDYLKTLDHEANTNLETIPSAAFRTGDLSAAPTQIYDPTTGNSTTGVGRTAFAGNQIPATMINPVSAALLKLLPEPNQSFNQAKPSNDYFALLPFQKNTDFTDGKVDYNITDKDRLSARFSFQRPSIFQAPIFGNAGGPAQGAFEGTGVQKTYSEGLDYDHVFSPTFLMELRLGSAHYHNTAQQTDYGKADSTAVGIPGINVSSFTSGLVGITINGGFSNPILGYSASLPWVRSEANIDTVASFTKIFGNHTINFGSELRRLRDDLLQDQTFSPRGAITFSEAQTSIPGATTGFGNDFASFLLDVPSQSGRDLNTYFPAYRQWEFFSWVADRWQVTPKLTLDAGLRWEFYPPATPEFPGGFSNYDPTNNTLVIAGIGGNPSNLGMKTRYKYFAPRFGIAYRVTNSTVVRAGFGMSYAPFADNSYAYNYPVRANNSYQPAGAGYGPAVLDSGQTASFQAGFPIQQPIAIPSNGILAAPISQSYYDVSLNFKNPYVEQWNFAVQQALPAHFTLDVAYVGNHGVDEVAMGNINAGLIIGAGTKGQPEYPRTAATTLLFQPFSSLYNSLQIKLDHRFSKNLLLTTAFTWARAMNFQSDDDGGLDFYINQHRNYAPADFDRKYSYVQSFNYALPVGPGQRWLNHGFASNIAGGWQLSGILTALSGTPFTLTYSASGLQAPNNTQTPNVVAPVQILKGINTNPWLSISSFAAPANLTFGSVGRNSIFGPGFFNLNLSLFKEIKISERFNLEIRGETLNFTNTPQFNNPGTGLGSSNFGEVTGTVGSGSGANGVGGGRVVQLGAKFTF
jgi:hypothetical protein